MILSLLILQILLTVVSSKHISGIFTSFNSLRWEDGNSYKYAGPDIPNWIADLSWRIDGSTMLPGDTFTLSMPCVFHFTTMQKSFNLRVGTTNYATCNFNPGIIYSPHSELNCVLSQSVRDSTKAFGTLWVPITFNPGFSAIETDLICSKYFKAGSNEISFYDGNTILTTTATFEKRPRNNPNEIVYALRKIPAIDKHQQYLLAGNCPNGFAAGTLSVLINHKSGSWDCSSIHNGITTFLNDWDFPRNAFTTPFVTYTCSSSGYVVVYKDIPAGHRVFLHGLVSIPIGNVLSATYLNKYVCSGSIRPIDESRTVQWNYYRNGEAGSNGYDVKVETETQTWTGSFTQTSTKTFDETDPTITVVVDVPIPTTTYYSTYIGISTSYTTYTVHPGATASVIEYEPVHTTTTDYSCWEEDETVTDTIIKTDWATDTILVVTPCPETVQTTEDSTEDSTDTTGDGTDTTEDGTDTTEDGTDTTEDGTDTTEDDATDTTEDGTDTTDDSTDTTDDSTDTTEDGTVTTDDSTDTTEDGTDTTEDGTDTTDDATDTTEDSTGDATGTTEYGTDTTEHGTDTTDASTGDNTSDATADSTDDSTDATTDATTDDSTEATTEETGETTKMETTAETSRDITRDSSIEPTLDPSTEQSTGEAEPSIDTSSTHEVTTEKPTDGPTDTEHPTQEPTQSSTESTGDKTDVSSTETPTQSGTERSTQKPSKESSTTTMTNETPDTTVLTIETIYTTLIPGESPYITVVTTFAEHTSSISGPVTPIVSTKPGSFGTTTGATGETDIPVEPPFEGIGSLIATPNILFVLLITLFV
ncbi:Agglutinin-like protein 1 [Spathaspora sp. JA1]|nr:Agglutinin-like protein 1 [Spathaspora sp. JA1]